MAGRHGKYLYQRSGSANWYLRLVYPPELHRVKGCGKRREISLGTADRDEAMVRALPSILEHKRALLMVRSMMRGNPMGSDYGYQPGREYPQADGSKIVATPKQLIHIDASGVFIKVEPNEPREKTIWETTPAEAIALGFSKKQVEGMTFAEPVVEPPKRKPEADTDIDLLTAYLRFKGHDPEGPYAREARAAWDEFKRLVNGKRLADCDRKDGFAYVEYLRGEKLKTATVVKRVNFLAAPINHANATGEMRTNPFFKVIDHKDDALQRVEFSDADMTLMRDHVLPNLDADERRMWLILATTGMRHSEAFEIRDEHERGGIRFWRIGKKTESSRREVPIPDCLAEHLPARIDGPLFTDPSLKNISKNLLRAVRRAGIKDPQKVVYSLRHRAHTRLRAIECPSDFERAIVGHETGESHVRYGSFPLPRLKGYIDQIGF